MRPSKMPSEGRLPLAGRVFVASVVVAGTTALLDALYHLCITPTSPRWLLLAALTLFSGSFTIKVPSIPATISVSETFVFASVLLFGTPAATVTVALDGLIMSCWRHRRNVHKVLFNAAEPAFSIWLASEFFFWIGRIQPLAQQPRDVSTVLLPILVLASTYFLLNSGLTALAVSFETGTPVWTLWQDHFLWLSLNYFVGASVAALIVQNATDISFTTISIILPLLLISYLTFKASMGRVEDADRHLAELNRLHMSTIETLAMAIDAKDQITHGHIRRVQRYAVDLAESLGLKDRLLMKAVQAAALLHDMGKLAVPEYILNKPGKLTTAEMDKMRLHSAVGADLLSAIDFPYPVVPIVRHHHENWDGTGYPEGLSGLDIPIGARILAVVDCFDALTSDRPYRSKLADRDAFAVLQERRGTMYDPLMVDTFMRVYQNTTAADSDLVADKSALLQIARSTRTRPDTPGVEESRLGSSVTSTDQMLVLHGLAQSLSQKPALLDAAAIISGHLRQLVPASLCVLYVVDGASDELVARHACGECAGLIRGLRIAFGERLSGWVAANRRTILNSDPILDLGDLSRSCEPRLRGCLSTPLLADRELVGVLSLYTVSGTPYTDKHRRLVELAGRQIAAAVKQGMQVETSDAASARRHSAETLRNMQVSDVPRLEMLPDGSLCPIGVILLQVNGLALVGRRFGRAIQEATRARVSGALCGILRSSDILFRHGTSGFVVLLTQTDGCTVRSIVARVRSALNSAQIELPDGSRFDAKLEAGGASAPTDGASLAELIESARQRLSPQLDTRSSQQPEPSLIH